MKKMIIPALLFVLFFLGCSNPTSSDPIPAPSQPNSAPTEDNKVTVSFDCQGGSAVSSQEVESGKTVETLPVSKKFTYTFDGWYTEVNGGGTKFLSDTIVKEDMTVYASWAQTAVVSTLAGSGAEGSNDGTGTDASFKYPYGVATDGAGNIYVADYMNHSIRKISPEGIVTTFAGHSGKTGSDNGTGTDAYFFWPNGVAVDGAGNVYVSDFGNNMIRKITTERVVTTLAESSQLGGITVDSAGTAYVTDNFKSEIRKITAKGVVTTLAGSGTDGSDDGTGTAASFRFPYGVAIDSKGNVYVADTVNNLIRKITPAGVVTTLAGSGEKGSSDGTGTTASFKKPIGVAVDSEGNVYVADSDNNLIRKITPAGVVTTLAGSGEKGSSNGNGTDASFNNPDGVAVDSKGTVYVADTSNNLIRKITQ